MAREVDLEEWLKELVADVNMHQAEIDRKKPIIAEIKRKLGLEPDAEDTPPETNEITPPPKEDVEGTQTPHIRKDAFFQMSMPRAAEKYLKMIKRPAHTKEICGALKKGGLLSQAKNLYVVVHSGLHRDKAFVKVNKDWGLAEWYPSRPKAAETTKTKKKRGRAGA